jgi:hypothetical protein
MGHVIEPEGVDFIIESNPKTLKEEAELSDFIKKRKATLKKQEEHRIKKKPEDQTTAS